MTVSGNSCLVKIATWRNVHDDKSTWVALKQRMLRIKRRRVSSEVTGDIALPTSVAPYTLKNPPSHLEVVIHPPIVEGTWTELAKLGDDVLTEARGRTAPNCIVDLSDVDYIGSPLVAVMVRIWKELRSRNGSMVLVAPHPLVRETISLAGLDKIWKICHDRPTAYRAIGVSPILSREGSPLERRSVARWIVFGILLVAAILVGMTFWLLNQQP